MHGRYQALRWPRATGGLGGVELVLLTYVSKDACDPPKGC